MAYTTIDDPSAYFQTALYTGNGGNQSITNVGNSDLQADWIWLKERSALSGHHVFDSSRGIGDSGKALIVNTNGAEGDDTAFRSFDSDGFTLASTGGFNESSQTNVAWQWKANGGTTSSNTDGSITSTVQANTTAGFSIVTYTGTGSSATVGHGLGSVPKMLIVKERDNANDWKVYHHIIGNNKTVRLDTTDGETSDTSTFASTTPTSSVFSVNSNATNRSGGGIVAYCFAEKQGYSKISSYTGNANADGPFIYTGFKPAWVIWKRTDASGNSWGLVDHRRNKNDTSDVGNVIDAYLNPDLNNDDGGNSATMDFLSNGFKVRRTGNFINLDGSTYIYMAFAEHPFVSSKGVPTTAR